MPRVGPIPTLLNTPHLEEAQTLYSGLQTLNNPVSLPLHTGPCLPVLSHPHPASQPLYVRFPPPGKVFPQIFTLAMATRVSDKMPLSPTGFPKLKIPFASIVPFYFLQSPCHSMKFLLTHLPFLPVNFNSIRVRTLSV